MQCPCGSDTNFKQCCFLLINQNKKAESPEQLMRSRYSAYATKSVEYIYQTYAESSKTLQSINEISEWAKETKWLRLSINSVSEYLTINDEDTSNPHESQHNTPTVTFSAYYHHQGKYCLMKETSRFIVEDNQWRYLNGEVSINEELVTPKRNDRCFCHSNKKFKQCCGS
jgi:SEC-C motif-containing protein